MNSDVIQCINQDIELFRETPGDYYSNSLHVTKDGRIGINCGGTVFVMPLKEWHGLVKLDRFARLMTDPIPHLDINQPSAIYPIGFKYTVKRPKFTREYEVIDYRRTYNNAGQLVEFRYVTSHDLLGQKVINRDVVHTTITMAVLGGAL